MVTSFLAVEPESGWERSPGYQRFEYTFKPGDKIASNEFQNSIGITVTDYARPVKSSVAALRFDSMFVFRFATRAFSAEWDRARDFARRRFLHIFVQKGSLEVGAGSDGTVLRAGWTGMLSPAASTVLLRAGHDTEFLAFSFDRDEVPELPPQSTVIARRVSESAVLQASFAFLGGAVQASRPADLEAAQVFRGLTRDVAKALTEEARPRTFNGDVVDVARGLIESRAASRLLDVEAVAREIAISRRSLERAFAERGLSVSNEIRQKRAALAHHKLSENDSDSMESIAFASGFGSVEVMRRALLRYYDASPAAIRASVQRFDSDPDQTGTS